MPAPEAVAPPSRVQRTRLYEQVAEQITAWIGANGLTAGDRLPPERELAARLGVSRATLSQALVALEVIGAVNVRHGDGTFLTVWHGHARIVESIREHADRLPEIIETRDALETKIASLAALRRTPTDLRRIDDALDAMSQAIDAGERGVEADEEFHAALTAAAHSVLLSRLMGEIGDLIRETRIESLSQPGRPRNSLAGHRQIAEAVRVGDQKAAAEAMHAHIELVSDLGPNNGPHGVRPGRTDTGAP